MVKPPFGLILTIVINGIEHFLTEYIKDNRSSWTKECLFISLLSLFAIPNPKVDPYKFASGYSCNKTLYPDTGIFTFSHE